MKLEKIGLLSLPWLFYAWAFTTQKPLLDPEKPWMGKKCAVVLTYDDALNVHLDNAIPLLDSLSLRGTFYLSGGFDGCKKRLKDWRKAAQTGHELGNHTLFHPCDATPKGREWVNAERDLSRYSVQRMVDEVQATNVLLEAIDGKNTRTFAYTCGDMTINGQPFIDKLKGDFTAARGVRADMHDLNDVDLYNVDAYPINGETGAQMIDLVKKAMASGRLLVFLFHGVGGEHGLNVDLQAHRELLYFLKNNENDVWVAPLVKVAEHVKKRQTAAQSAQKGLKDAYKNYFPIGVAVNPNMMNGGADTDLILREFSSMTAENAMKMGPIHPEENRYNWAPADKIADFAQKNGLLLRGHTLCWHNQTPSWFFVDSLGKTVSKDVLLARLKRHIFDVVGRYKGKIYAWDVVNEAVPDEPGQYRLSPFYQIIGEEYIEKAFQFAHEADPNAKLFYNDYNTENASKRERIYQLLKKLKAKGVPIHGVGLQGHWSIYEPTRQELEASIAKFAALGLDIHITEVDVSVYPKEHSARERRETDQSTFTEAQKNRQAEHYRMLFDVFRQHKDKVKSVTFWNLSDRRSWLDDFPVRGRKDYPLLFDENFNPKKAYWEVVKF